MKDPTDRERGFSMGVFLVYLGAAIAGGGLAMAKNAAKTVSGALKRTKGKDGKTAPQKKPSDEPELPEGFKHVYDAASKAPKWPCGFKGKKRKEVKVQDDAVKGKLQNTDPTGTWKKVYYDGYDADGKKISVHYFEHSSGKAVDVEVHTGWSNE